MKAAGLFGIFCLLSVAVASAQTQAPAQPLPTLTATNRLQRIFGPTAVYDGVFPEVKRRGALANSLDLRAPVVPGKEFRNVSINPHTGRPQGVVLIAVKF